MYNSHVNDDNYNLYEYATNINRRGLVLFDIKPNYLGKCIIIRDEAKPKLNT